MSMFDYSGCLHIHTTYSDGSSDIESVIETAKKAGLDYIIITDHDTLKAREDGYEGYHNGVLVIVGYELSPPDRNHFLVMGTDSVIENKNPEVFIDKVRDAGGVGIIAHPDHIGIPKIKLSKIIWSRWDLDGYTGVSVWDLMTDIQLKLKSVPTAIPGIFNPVLYITGPRKKSLTRWDKLNRIRRVVGVCELDNHGVIVGKKPFTYEIFPNRFAFKTLRNHIHLEKALTGDSSRDIDRVLNAISHGKLHIGFDYFYDTGGFDFYCKSGGKTIKMGSRNSFDENTTAYVDLPKRGHIKILRDGEEIFRLFSRSFRFTITDSGVYRVEVYKETPYGLRPWIYSNPIVFTDG